MTKSSFFQIKHKCRRTSARVTQLSTLNGEVLTPVFLPVGTQATVRSLTPEDLHEIGFEMILCNSYHLSLRPGIDVINKAGGLHKFMGWDKPILTDSGGYQVFSLSSFRDITEAGVKFRSHIDGSEHYISPETAVQIQETLGSDVMMVLDVCPASTTTKSRIQEAVILTAKWARKSQKARTGKGQYLFAIIQGGTYQDLRRMSAEQLVQEQFDGYAIGGLSLGESKDAMWDTVSFTAELMPEDKPRYLMGVGSPEDLFQGVSAGIDIFDSALPTRVARNGALFTRSGRVNIKKMKYSNDFMPVDRSCSCYTCRKFSSAYLSHLFRSEELLAYRLATIHNLYFMQSIIKEIRQSIANGTFTQCKMDFLNKYKITDEIKRIEQKSRYLDERRSEFTD